MLKFLFFPLLFLLVSVVIDAYVLEGKDYLNILGLFGYGFLSYKLAPYKNLSLAVSSTSLIIFLIWIVTRDDFLQTQFYITYSIAAAIGIFIAHTLSSKNQNKAIQG